MSGPAQAVVGLFILIGLWMLFSTLAWNRFKARHPVEDQRPGDVGQLASATGGCCGLLLIDIVIAAVLLFALFTIG